MSTVEAVMPVRDRVADRLRTDLRLLRIDLRRCGGYWPLPLALFIVWFLSQYLVSSDPVFWHQMSTATMQSYVVLGPLAAGIAAWQTGRDRRRRIDDFLASTASPAERRDLLAIAVGVGWGQIAYLIVGTYYLGQAALAATWGGPDIVLITVGALAVVLYAVLGVLIGQLPLLRFAPLIAVAVTASIAGLMDMQRDANGQQFLRGLSPWHMSNIQGEQEAIFFRQDWQSAAIFWVLGLSVAAVTIVLLLRRRSLVRLGVLAVSIAVTVVAAQPLLGAPVGDGFPTDGDPVPFEWSCTTRPSVELCVHPAWESKRDETADQFEAMLGPIAGLPGVPTRVEQGTPTGANSPDTAIFWQLHPFAVVDSVSSFLGTANDSGQTRAEIVILSWLAHNAGIGREDGPAFYFPSDIPMVQNESFFGPDEAAIEAFNAERDAAVSRLDALTPEERRVWFEANWDALQDGTLTMDRLP